ncbi:MAG: virulence RhuM family protein [Alphaproteobacteria bacterium]|jgi:hypothetical protein|nr:virulence RhuM family protein [Alphaproteobacteria bacterium]
MKELQFLLYSTPTDNVKVDVVVSSETIWLSQKGMAMLFDVGVPAINKHLKNIFEDGELIEDSVISILEITANDGKNYQTQFYNLDAIISVGYRVNSNKATQFRIWATKILKEFMQKGFVLDDERLKQGQSVFGKDYFQELLERVRSIRASERHIWLKITDIFAECSLDYDKNSTTTKEFFATVQNKFHYAIAGQTASEIINTKADKTKDNMGLTTWKNAPSGRILQSDVLVAKNYLLESEIKQLERTVGSYFDYVEGLIERKNTFTMQEFAESINKFLAFNEYKILEGAGSVSREQANEKAIAEYDEFNKTQKINSDFDKQIKKLQNQCS